MHLLSVDERAFLAEKAETRISSMNSPENRRWLLHRLVRAENLEYFLAENFPASKRFGIEGCEALIPGIGFEKLLL